MTATALTGSRPDRLLDRVPLLSGHQVQPGERWVYSAGFNVAGSLSETTRIDCELADLERLARAGARVAVLSHQGSRRARTARRLDFAAAYLSRRLQRPVAYLEDPLSPEARQRVGALREGEIALVGNTRLLAGEEDGDSRLAAELARLGDRVAVGGFSKAHRAHSSNVGILDHLPGFAAASLVEEVAALEPWARPQEGGFSVAALGGLKREKIDPGFASLAHRYDLVIPGGAVLNALLAARGIPIGDSDLGECEAAAATAASLLDGGCRGEIHLPREVIVAPAADPAPAAARRVAVGTGVPAGQAIVDFVLQPWARQRLGRLRRGGRAVLAGTPSLYRAGFGAAAGPLLEAMAAPGAKGLLLGGDTVAELPWEGPRSSGGGSALTLLATGSCAVLDALAENGRRR